MYAIYLLEKKSHVRVIIKKYEKKNEILKIIKIRSQIQQGRLELFVIIIMKQFLGLEIKILRKK